MGVVPAHRTPIVKLDIRAVTVVAAVATALQADWAIKAMLVVTALLQGGQITLAAAVVVLAVLDQMRFQDRQVMEVLVSPMPSLVLAPFTVAAAAALVWVEILARHILELAVMAAAPLDPHLVERAQVDPQTLVVAAVAVAMLAVHSPLAVLAAPVL